MVISYTHWGWISLNKEKIHSYAYSPLKCIYNFSQATFKYHWNATISLYRNCPHKIPRSLKVLYLIAHIGAMDAVDHSKEVLNHSGNLFSPRRTWIHLRQDNTNVKSRGSPKQLTWKWFHNEQIGIMYKVSLNVYLQEKKMVIHSLQVRLGHIHSIWNTWSIAWYFTYSLYFLAQYGSYHQVWR